MNNLYRELAPITDAAWAEIEQEATRTFKRHIAGRRVVDVSEPGGAVTAAVSTGHLVDAVAPSGDDLLLLQYTGGTTGHPKGVMWPQDTLFRMLEELNNRTPDETALSETIRNTPISPVASTCVPPHSSTE